MSSAKDSAKSWGMKKTSESVKKSRAKAGLKPTSLVLTDAEKGEIDSLAAELGVGRKDAILEAVRSYKCQGQITTERLLQEIKRRLR